MIIGLIIFFFIFLLGLSVGSFINVLESRLYENEDILRKPSHCDFCKCNLKPIDLIPVVSWLIYKGKTRCCHRRLSIQYPIVEIVTGVGLVLIFSLGFLRISSGFLRMENNNLTIQQFNNLLFYFIIFIFTFTIFLQDLKYQAIHGGLLKALIIATFAHIVFGFFFSNGTMKQWNNVIVAFLSALPFYLLYKLSHETWLGEGDVWIAFWMGLFLGFPKVFSAMYFGIIAGGVVSLIVLLLHLKKMRDTISLGPFLLIGVLISLLWRF